jgi:3-ketosteroid 9alpha-monooxygenase subunit B
VSFHELSVERVLDETADARSYVLTIPAELAERFRYRAGQHLTFEIPHDGAHILRCYSLASSPERGEPHKVTVKRVPDGRGSGWFHDQVKAGTKLRVMPPLGFFVLHESTLPLLFFAGGSGITPVIALIKSALAATARRIRLLYANRDARSVIFQDELDALARRHPERFECLHHLDAAGGFLDADGVRRALRGFEDAEAYLCGPAPFMALVGETLRGAGVPEGRIHIERFELPTPSAATGNAPGRERMRAAPPAGAEGATPAPTEIVVHLEGQVHRIPYQPGQTLLDAARKAGLQPPFACEEAFCGSCAAKKLRGSVVLDRNDVFTAQDLAAGWILTCHGRATSPDCEISWDT